MLDNQGRNIRYLRLSVTDRCNFRCRYCMPAEGVCKREHSEMLSFEELTEIVQTAVSLGVSKVRLTGGEPLVRRGIVDLCRSLRAINGVRELTMTTNGALLPQYAAELKQAGVDRLNISLDTLNEDKFASLTRGGSLVDTLAGLDAAQHAGFRVKRGVPATGAGQRICALRRSVSVREAALVISSWNAATPEDECRAGKLAAGAGQRI